jgi:hypothetical protein
LTSTRGLSPAAIGSQLGVTEAAVNRAAAKFRELTGIKPGAGLQPIATPNRSPHDLM